MSSWKNNKSTKKLANAVICAIALHEELYIDEWIQYHLALGFSYVYIYDNSDTNTLAVKQTDRVIIIHFPGKQKQFEAYNLFALQYKNKYQWAAFIDCDEFIVLKKHASITDFLRNYTNHAAIGLNWKMFGTAHHIAYENRPVLERFQLCANKLDHHIKSICQLRYICTIANPHYAELLGGSTYDTHHNIIDTGPYNANGSDDIACIHHYYTKSEEEFRKKILRGRADIVEHRSLEELNRIHSKNNDITNTDAWDFFRANCI
jgi:hypothetical protein